MSEGQRLPIDKVEQLVDLLQESGIGEIQVRQGDVEITVKARTEVPSPPVSHATPPPVAAQEPVDAAPEIDGPQRNGLHAVHSPLVGTFYRSSAPGEDVYVEVGDRVEAGQTLCIVEAMKLMNEIPADVSGEVVEVLPKNASGVEYDEPLFYLRPGE